MLSIIMRSLNDYVDLTADQITEKTNPAVDLHLNSYDYISLIGKLESELGIVIPEHDLRSFETLGDLDHYIRVKLQH